MTDLKSTDKPVADISSNWTAQLVVLRDLTKRFGTLHEAQVLQLKLWPFTVDNTIEKSEASVDVEGKTVHFCWGGASMKIDAKYRTRLDALCDNVKFLLGDDWSMAVTSSGVTIFPLDTNERTKRSHQRGNSKSRKPGKRNGVVRKPKGRRKN